MDGSGDIGIGSGDAIVHYRATAIPVFFSINAGSRRSVNSGPSGKLPPMVNLAYYGGNINAGSFIGNK